MQTREQVSPQAQPAGEVVPFERPGFPDPVFVQAALEAVDVAWDRMQTRLEVVQRECVQAEATKLEERAKLLRCRVKDLRPPVRRAVEREVLREVWAPQTLAALQTFAGKVREVLP